MKELSSWILERSIPGVHDCETLSVLDLVGKTAKKTNEVVGMYNNLEEETKKLEGHKVSKIDLKEKHKIDDDNFTGKWHGVEKPSMLNDGLNGAVDVIEDRIDSKLNISNITTTTHEYKNGTKYYITHIPYMNEDGTYNLIKKSYAKDIPNVTGNEVNFSSGEYICEHAIRKNAVVGINASAFGSRLIGSQIRNGHIQQDCESDISYKKNYQLGITKENQLKVYEYDVKAADMIKDGVYNSFCFMTPIIQNGVDVPQSIKDLYSNGYTLLANRQMIAQRKDNRDIYILTTEGRTFNDVGMTFQDCTDILLDMNMWIAYALDGGGSTSLFKDGYLINKPSETNSTTRERLVFDMLYVEKKDSIDSVKELSTVSEKAMEQIKKEILSLLNKNYFNSYIRIYSDESYNSKGILIYENDVITKRLLLDKSGFKILDVLNNNSVLLSVDSNNMSVNGKENGEYYKYPNKEIKDLNEIKSSGDYWVTNTCLNIPSPMSYHIKHIQVDNINAMQIATPYSSNILDKPKRRRISSGVFTNWIDNV